MRKDFYLANRRGYFLTFSESFLFIFASAAFSPQDRVERGSNGSHATRQCGYRYQQGVSPHHPQPCHGIPRLFSRDDLAGNKNTTTASPVARCKHAEIQSGGKEVLQARDLRALPAADRDWQSLNNRLLRSPNTLHYFSLTFRNVCQRCGSSHSDLSSPVCLIMRVMQTARAQVCF